MKKEITKKIFLLFLVLCTPIYLYIFDPLYLQDSDKISNVRIFKNEEFWPLAIAVNKEDVTSIIYFTKKHPSWVNSTGSKFDISLLFFAVTTEKYKSAEALLKAGADPNIRMMKLGGQTALYDASCYSSVDSDAKKDPRFIKLLLEYGADPNLYYLGGEDMFSNSTEIGDSPLIHSIGCGIEKTKALVNGGAEIDHTTNSGSTAAIKSLITGNVQDKYLEYSKYLIVERKASIKNQYCNRVDIKTKQCLEHSSPVTLLRDWWIYDIDSEKYNTKLLIIDEFARQDINYWQTPISVETMKKIKKLYPDTWQEYIKQY